MKTPVYDENFIWRTAAGEEIAVKDMTDLHLCRLLVYVEKRSLAYPPFGQKYQGFSECLRNQIVKRNLIELFEKENHIPFLAKPVLVEDLSKIKDNEKKVSKLVNEYFFEADEVLKPRSKS